MKKKEEKRTLLLIFNQIWRQGKNVFAVEDLFMGWDLLYTQKINIFYAITGP